MSQIQVSGKNFLTVSFFFSVVVTGPFLIGISSALAMCKISSSKSVNVDNNRKKNT